MPAQFWILTPLGWGNQLTFSLKEEKAISILDYLYHSQLPPKKKNQPGQPPKNDWYQALVQSLNLSRHPFKISIEQNDFLTISWGKKNHSEYEQHYDGTTPLVGDQLHPTIPLYISEACLVVFKWLLFCIYPFQIKWFSGFNSIVSPIGNTRTMLTSLA